MKKETGGMTTEQLHRKKMIAPVTVTVLMIIYYMVYFGILMAHTQGMLKAFLGIFPLAFAAVSIYVLKQRIEEIRSGEEDDLDNY